MRYKFFLVDATDIDTAITGVTPTVKLSVNGAAFSEAANSPVEVSDGEYYVDLTVSELGSDGPIGILITATGARVWRDILRQVNFWDEILSGHTIVGSAGHTLDKVNSFASLTEINVVSIIDGDTITVNRYDSWEIPIPNLPDLSEFTSIAFVVKENQYVQDVLAQLSVRSDSGLITIGGVAPSSSSNGTVVIGTEAITVDIDISETSKTEEGTYTWWIKGFDSVDGDGVTIARGTFVIGTSGSQDIS